LCAAIFVGSGWGAGGAGAGGTTFGVPIIDPTALRTALVVRSKNEAGALGAGAEETLATGAAAAE
jgi:hypothetical protein